MRHPGEVWFLPLDAVEGGDAKQRRHVLLTRCEEHTDHRTFAYASSKRTEAAFGAAALLLDPSRTDYGRAGRTGFDRATYIYPSRLIGARTKEMRRMTGRLLNELTDLRTVLQEALGIGTGTGAAPGDSWRGRIIRFSDPLRRDLGCAHGLIVTEPFYSSRRRYQLVVPVLDLRDFESSETDVLVDGKEWLPSIFGDLAPVAFATDLIQAVFHPTDVAASTAAVVDEGTLARIDARLTQLFDL